MKNLNAIKPVKLKITCIILAVWEDERGKPYCQLVLTILPDQSVLTIITEYTVTDQVN